MKAFLLIIALFVQQQQTLVPLSRPLNWGDFTTRVFSDSRRITFHLETSWTPGEKQKGMLRYKLTAYPEMFTGERPDNPTQEVAAIYESLMQRLDICVITANLYDVDGFLLRDVRVPFSRGVDDNGRILSLSANSSVQMSASEYRAFIGTRSKSGTWNISWAC